MQLEETGLIRQWVKMLPWIPRADKCFADDAKATAKQTSIKLIDLASAFFILGIGLAVSTFAFIAERMFFYRAKRKARVNAFSQSTRR